MAQLALFPLNIVLFPGGPLQLRIFEKRYLDMVSRCLREDTGFGVCLIRQGNEVGTPATPFEIGTVARIVDWERRQDGLLGITALGEERFRIRSTAVGADGLLLAETEHLPAPCIDALPRQPAVVHELVNRILQLKGMGYEHVQPHWDSAHWLGCRLAEALPLDLPARQRLLEMDDPLERLRSLQPMVPNLVCE